ncbi:MAG: 6-bladed beta-propeller [Desulfuromonadales bacterium]|nr:6-bladed beta-propeller [Desulfuromonadales bacterium]
MILLTACQGRVVEAPATAPPVVWPPAPNEPRIAYVKSFSGPSGLGIERSLIGRLRDLVFGKQSRRLVRPMAVIATADAIFVADPGVRGVHRFDTEAGRYTLVRGPKGAPLPSPVGLTEGGSGEVYVTDSKLGRVFAIRPGEKEAEPLELGADLVQPTGIAYDPAKQRLLVTDTMAHRIVVFDREHRLLATIGERGDGEAEFNFPTMLWRSSRGRLYVTDSLNFRIQILDGEGDFIGAFGRQGDRVGDAPRPKGVATDRNGHLYVVDSLLHNVQIFDDAGRFLLPVGQQGQGPGEFWLPAGIFIDRDDRIYVADSYNRRIQVLRYLGGER